MIIPSSTPEQDDERSDAPPGRARFPIVGVGASAGGLEAFTKLLGAMPLDAGVGLVLVQHLDPEHESALAQILARATSLPVHEIVHDQPVEPNHVYIIPRDTSLTIERGVLKLAPRQRMRTPHRPIDAFFESLARDQRECAVGVVLSGTANDGTLGLKAIKVEGGITFAQDDSAKHHSMPHNAVAAGCVDLVLSPAEIAKELTRLAKHPYVAGQSLLASAEDDATSAPLPQDGESPPPSGERGSSTRAERELAAAEGDRGNEAPSGYKQILLLLRNHSGVDFSFYKSKTIQRRINRRLLLSSHDSLEEYAGFLRSNAKELDTLYSDVLISVTSFFRNPETFDVLQQSILPELLGQQRGERPLRCWVLGCSTGQEAYSIAMAFVEAAEGAARMHKLQVFATDLNDALLDKARHGLYAKSVADELTPERLRRFFVEEEGGYRVTKALREMVVFARQNLIADPPFSRMDLISCRNLLIYLEPSLQKKAMPTFHYALQPGGFLLLGASESVGTFTDLFEPVDKKHKIYAKKTASSVLAPHLPFGNEPRQEIHRPPTLQRLGGIAPGEDSHGELNAQREADRITVSRFAPPGVLVSADLQILQFRGPTGDFLEPPVGKASFDVLRMAREGLMLPLRSAMNQARAEQRPTRRDDVLVERDGGTFAVNLEVIPLKNVREPCLLILFENAGEARRVGDHARPASAVERDPLTPEQEKSRVAQLEAELSEMREYLGFTQEQHQAASEELQAASEEVQSANEELQSINEELETSKEELESANEELTTVNEEMSSRNLELSRINNDLVNLQASTKLAIMLLGRELTVRRFSPQAEKQLDLLATDVGRPVRHIRHDLRNTSGAPVDLESLSARVVTEVREEEQEVSDRGGRWYSLRVRPYMTLDNKVDGAVLVLVDITERMRASEAPARLAAIVESSDDAILSKDLLGIIRTWNAGATRLFGHTAEEAVGKSATLVIPRDRVDEEHQILEQIRRGEVVDQLETVRQRKDGSRLDVSLTVSPIRDVGGRVVGASTIARDITDRKAAERTLEELNAKLRESERRYRGLFESIDEGFCVIEKVEPEAGEPLDFRYIEVNEAFAAQSGLADVVGKTIREVVPGEPEAWFLTYDTVCKTGLPMRFQRELVTQARVLELYAFRVEGHGQRRVAVIFKDVTAHKRLETELRRYATELSEADDRKNEFLAMLGHELRNPLSALSYGLELWGMVPDDLAQSKALREMMVRQTLRIGTLLDQLLDIARLISDKVELSRERVDLVDVVRAAVETVRSLVELRKHDLVLALPSDGSTFVEGDAVRLSQVLENLLANATKYTNEGGRIELTVAASEHHVRISVRDTGIGISAEFLPHVFDVFSQAPRALDRAMGGLGLGLPLVRRLVEMHGGEVGAASPGVGQGSEFVVTLPRAPERRSQEREDEPAPTPLHQAPRRRVLVVDDEADAAATLAGLLEASGHIALVACDGSAALAAVSTFNPDVVLLDIGLPGMEGYEVAKRLREEHGNREILLIAVTGYQHDVERLEQAGFDRHLLKPPDLRELFALLATGER